MDVGFDESISRVPTSSPTHLPERHPQVAALITRSRSRAPGHHRVPRISLNAIKIADELSISPRHARRLAGRSAFLALRRDLVRVAQIRLTQAARRRCRAVADIALPPQVSRSELRGPMRWT